MYKFEVENLDELNVVEKAIATYRKIQERDKEVKMFLESKDHQLGDYVIKKGTSYFDNVFGTVGGTIGKIVDWDFENNYYRVYFNEVQPYQGVTEDRLEVYEGEASTLPSLKQLMKIKTLRVEL